MIGIRSLTHINDVTQVKCCEFSFDCVLTAGLLTFTASAVPDEYFLKYGLERCAQLYAITPCVCSCIRV